MRVDELGHAAAGAARSATATIDSEMMLRRLHHRRRRQQTLSITAAVAVSAVLLAGVVEVARPADTPAASRPAPTATSALDDPCNEVTILCVGANRFRISLTVPVTVTLPENFEGIARQNDSSFESYRTDVHNAGVSVLENAVPVRNDASWSRDPSAGTTAAAMANWLSKRPFLTDVNLAPITVDGRPAWRVSAALKPRAPLRAAKLEEGAVAPTFTDGHNATMGYNATLRGEYILLDIPGAGVTVLWSWTLGPPRTQLAGNRPFIDALHW
ncbi:MAG: hypothetical protein ACJ71T_01000 [Actinomycetales bacterium]